MEREELDPRLMADEEAMLPEGWQEGDDLFEEREEFFYQEGPEEKAEQEQMSAEEAGKEISESAKAEKENDLSDIEVKENFVESAVESVAENRKMGEKERAEGEQRSRPQRRDIFHEYQQLKLLYPDLQEIPPEVAEAMNQGVPLLSAYLAFGDRQRRELEKENRVLKQNADAAARAPVGAVSGGGAVQKKSDPFISGFDSERW